MSCKLFLHNPMLLMSPHHVRSSVSGDVFRPFVRAIEGHDPDFTHENCPALNLLCDKFEFTRLGSKALLTRPYHVTSSIGANLFRAFVNPIDGISPTLTNENITDIGLLCDDFGYEQLSATVAEFLAQHSSPGERACRKVIAVKAQNAAFASQIGALKAEVADLTAQSSRAVAVKSFRAEQFLAEMIKIGLEMNVSSGKETDGMYGVPGRIIAHLTRECGGNGHDRHQSGHLGELFAVVGLPGGSRVTGGLSARGLANAPVGDWSDHFTFIVGAHRSRCPSSVAQFLSPRVSKLHSIDPTISELRLEVEDRDELFGSVLEAAEGNSIAVDSAHR
jgi:hypothetical protein